MAFNDRASHISKTDKSNNNVPASCNHLSSETAAEQKISAPDNSSRNNENFPNPLMLINNVYNFDAHPWPKNTILIVGDSMINGINEKRISIQPLLSYTWVPTIYQMKHDLRFTINC